MSHRIGRVIPQSPAVIVGPGHGTQVSPGRWRVTFSPAPATTGTKFLMLHFTGAVFGVGDQIEIPLGYDTDRFDAADGPSFWSRPIKGDSVDVFFVDGGSGAGQASLSEFGRGEGLQLGGANASAGGNANGDVFMIESPYVEPTFFNSSGICPSGASPSWENVAKPEVSALMRDTARSVGMLIDAHAGDLSTCSATVIGPDLILTAGHCADSLLAIESGSFTLDFQTDAVGNRPPGYNPRFHKMKRLVKTGFSVSGVGAGVSSGSGLDYAVIQIEAPPGGLGVPPRPIRATLPGLHEELFVIHHPRGSVKKVSRKPTDPTCEVLASGSILTYACDSDNGSSGSPVFDTTGSIVAVNDWAPSACGNLGQAASVILVDFTNPAPAFQDVNAILVFDRSGSMSELGFRGDKTKIQEAREAAALFIDLLRTDRTHQAGLATFSTTSSLDFALAPISPANKDTLIGPAPARNAGVIGGITPGGSTTIGGGLHQGQGALPAPGTSSNLPAILLLTDGLENTPPLIADVEGELASTRLCIIGFGSEGSVDGPRLTALARTHGGIYTRAGEGLQLKKFFVLCFGNIFQTGVSMDPFFVFPAGSAAMPPFPLQVCGEETIVVVLSWESDKESLILNLTTPAGNPITRTTPGVFASSGSTWVYFRLQLPFSGERDGTWQIQVTRFAGEGEFSAPLEEERFFVTATVDGGPYFRPLGPRRYYTGDTINPQVILREPSGFLVHAEVTLDVELPQEGTGNILTQTGLRAATEKEGDAIDSRASTLIALEKERGPLIPVTTQRFELVDDGELDGDGALEPDGVFGNPLKDLSRFEGNYTFHAVATYGEGCTGTRETTWTTYVSIGIDPSNTGVKSDPLGTGPGGCVLVRATLTPRDRYGNHLGPGRPGAFEIAGQPGSEPIGGVRDNGDGSYSVDLCWDPESSTPPGVIVTQPERPPVGVPLPVPEGFEKFIYSVKFLCGVQADSECHCAPVRPGSYATEINIHNYLGTEVKIEKYVIPVVFAGAAAGREPRVATRKASDRIVLPPHAATMDDCCRLNELLLGASTGSSMPMTIGFLEIVSNQPLSISAVYTVTDPKSGSVSMDVEQIQGRRTR